MCCPSATLAVWSAAWLHGAAASDDALDALQAWGEVHEVVAADAGVSDAFEIPITGDVPAGPAQLLTALRRLGTLGARMVLPVPGDVRGLGGGGPFTEAALNAGEAVLLTGTGYGLVPQTIAEGLLRWTVYPVSPGTTPEHVSLGEAEHTLSTTIRDSAGALQELDVAGTRSGVRAELSAKLRARPDLCWPCGTPSRALRVLQRAEEIAAIVSLAHSDEPGGALSASAAMRRAELLRPLDDAVRQARCAAVNETARILAGASEAS